MFYIPKLNRDQIEVVRRMLRMRWGNKLLNTLESQVANGDSAPYMAEAVMYVTDSIFNLMDVTTVWQWHGVQTGTDPTPCVMSPTIYKSFSVLVSQDYTSFRNHDLPPEIVAELEHLVDLQPGIQKAFEDAPFMDENALRSAHTSGKGFGPPKPALLN